MLLLMQCLMLHGRSQTFTCSADAASCPVYMLVRDGVTLAAAMTATPRVSIFSSNISCQKEHVSVSPPPVSPKRGHTAVRGCSAELGGEEAHGRVEEHAVDAGTPEHSLQRGDLLQNAPPQTHQGPAAVLSRSTPAARPGCGHVHAYKGNAVRG